MDEYETVVLAVGYDPPLLAAGCPAQPSQRDVSIKWLGGLALTFCIGASFLGFGIYSGASTQLVLTDASMAAGARHVTVHASFDTVTRTRRIRSVQAAGVPTDTDIRIMQASTVLSADYGKVLRSIPFAQLKIVLGRYPDQLDTDPDFLALQDQADRRERQAFNGKQNTADDAGGKINTEIVDFPLETATFSESDLTGDARSEAQARHQGQDIVLVPPGPADMASLDPSRFGQLFFSPIPPRSRMTRILTQNVSISERAHSSIPQVFSEDVIKAAAGTTIFDALFEAGFELDAESVAAALAELDRPDTDRSLQIGIERDENSRRLVRVTLAGDGGKPITIARNDQDVFVLSSEPVRPKVLQAVVENAMRGLRDVSLEEAIGRSALLNGLSPALTRQLFRLFKDETDKQGFVGINDSLELFFSYPDPDGRASEASGLYFARLTFGGRNRTFYRYELFDGEVDYFGPEGRNLHEALLRKPIAHARISSTYGMRPHPILGFTRMHSGVDWAAPAGTPILAAANGVVTAAGWKGGYGRRTVIRHANGYETSYSHQSAIADAVVRGAAVRQGQIIGFVGSSGLATGSHLHFEVKINGNTVDPMRVRLPEGRILRNEELETFLAERDRIDALLYDPSARSTQVVASRR